VSPLRLAGEEPSGLLALQFALADRLVFRGGDRGVIDLLVDLAPDADLLDIAGLNVELERLLGHPVNVLPTRMLKSRVASSALADALTL
jgi:hypothetical protein